MSTIYVTKLNLVLTPNYFLLEKLVQSGQMTHTNIFTFLPIYWYRNKFLSRLTKRLQKVFLC